VKNGFVQRENSRNNARDLILHNAQNKINELSAENARLIDEINVMRGVLATATATLAKYEAAQGHQPDHEHPVVHGANVQVSLPNLPNKIIS
jgi:hypothetical protein